MTGLTIPTDIEIAQSATLRPITAVAADLGLSPDDNDQCGKFKTTLTLELAARPPRSELAVVTAINLTPAGEGNNTVSVGLAQALRPIDTKAVLASRAAERARSESVGVAGTAQHAFTN